MLHHVARFENLFRNEKKKVFKCISSITCVYNWFFFQAGACSATVIALHDHKWWAGGSLVIRGIPEKDTRNFFMYISSLLKKKNLIVFFQCLVIFSIVVQSKALLYCIEILTTFLYVNWYLIYNSNQEAFPSLIKGWNLKIVHSEYQNDLVLNKTHLNFLVMIIVSFCLPIFFVWVWFKNHSVKLNYS